MQMNRGKLTGAQDISVCCLKACCPCRRVLSLAPKGVKTPRSCSSHQDPFALSKEQGKDSIFTFSVLAMLVLCTVLGARESFVMV